MALRESVIWMINLVGVFAEGMEKDDTWGTGNLHVSDLGASSFIPDSDRKCARQIYLRLNDAEKAELGPGKKLMFEQGHHLEERVIEWVKRGLYSQDNGYYIVGTQINISAGIQPLRGTLDILLTNNNDFCVIDVKTRRGASFRYSNDIKPANKFQIAGYIYALNNLLKQPIRNGKVIEVDREGQNFAREFDFIYTDELKQKIEVTMQELIDIREGYKPDKLYPDIKINQNKGANSVKASLPWQCRYCDYYSHSCDGAIPKEYEDNLGKVVGHIRDGEFDEKYEGISEYIEGELK